MVLAGCIIQDSDGKVLLIHRNTPKRVQWEIPGGGVEAGETPEAAAIRELKEELGVTVAIVRQVGNRSFEEDGEQFAYHWFEATVQDGEPTLTTEDEDTYDDLRYFTLAEVETMFDTRSANTRNLLQAIQTKEATLR